MKGEPMLHFQASKLAVFASVCSLSGVVSSAQAKNYATEWSGGSVINLDGLPGASDSAACAINDAGQIVGISTVGNFPHAVEWSGGQVVDLGGLPGSTASEPQAINDAGQVAGASFIGNSGPRAVEWSGGQIIVVGGLYGSTVSLAFAIKVFSQLVGWS